MTRQNNPHHSKETIKLENLNTKFTDDVILEITRKDDVLAIISYFTSK